MTKGGVPQGVPSVKVTDEQFYKHVKDIGTAPTQFQRYIDKAFELRVTVIDETVFAVRIDSQLDERTKIDWRLNTHLSPHSAYVVPERISAFCIAFLKAQGLDYGAFDFIVTPDGDFVFLENNPFGQYLWLEHETGLPITRAMSEMLLKYARA